MDITVYHGGFHGDLNETFFVGNVDDESRKLVQTAYECMMKGIAIGELVTDDVSASLHVYFESHDLTFLSSSTGREVSQHRQRDPETCSD